MIRSGWTVQGTHIYLISHLWPYALCTVRFFLLSTVFSLHRLYSPPPYAGFAACSNCDGFFSPSVVSYDQCFFSPVCSSGSRSFPQRQYFHVPSVVSCLFGLTCLRGCVYMPMRWLCGCCTFTTDSLLLCHGYECHYRILIKIAPHNLNIFK